MNKIVIIGCGNVGMSYAYALLNQKTNVSEIVLIDVNLEKAEGEAMDLNHGLPFAPNKIKVSVGNYSDCHNADITCIAAGVNQRPGETRLELLNNNKNIFKNIVDEVIKSGFNGIFLIATNPVDIMTYIVYEYSNFPHSKVIGTGTTLDTARLRYLIGEELNINSKNVHAYVMGEHGDSEFVSWSNAFVGTNKVSEFLSDDKLNSIALKVKNAAYEIINRKGATYYAIGMVLVRITNAILNDENTILTVSTYNDEHDIFIGTPSIVGRNGVVETMKLSLSENEKELFKNSASVIRNEINKINDIK